MNTAATVTAATAAPATTTVAPPPSGAKAAPRAWLRKRPVRIALGALLCLVLAALAIALTPARWAVSALSIPGPMLAVDAHGTLWSGGATFSFGRPELRKPVPGELRWRLGLDGGPHLAATHPGLKGELRLDLTWGGLRASPQTLRLPAGLLAAAYSRFAIVAPEGELELRWPSTLIGWGSAPPVGSERLDVRWNGAASWMTPVRPMGAYRLLLTQGDGARIDLALSTLMSPLMLEGAGTYSPAEGLHLDGKARFDTATTREGRIALRELLAALGTRRADYYQLSFQ
ncbi:type II secretion system protein N [Acidovorax sp. YS12]|nr:type II secretion system protein N [Acidovorax sp. YS12]